MQIYEYIINENKSDKKIFNRHTQKLEYGRQYKPSLF